MRFGIFFSGMLLGLAPPGLAVTITVDSSGGSADHTTIAAAVAAANPSGGDEIVVTNAGATYDETVTIDRPVILRGADPANPPVIATQSRTGSAFGDGDGLYIDTDGAVTLQDLVLIPSTDASMTDDIIMGVPGGSTSLDLTMTNILVTGNDGSGNPVVAHDTDDFTDIDTAAAGTKFCNDCIYLFASAELGIGRLGTLNVDMTNVRVLGVGADDGMVIYSGNDGSIALSDVVVTHSPDDGIQLGTLLQDTATGTVTISGTRADPGLLLWRTGDGLSLFEGGVVTMDRFVALETAGGVTQAGILLDMASITSIAITNSLFANNEIGISVQGAPAAAVPLDVNDTTFYANAESIDFLAANTASVEATFVDNIFAGAGVAVDNGNGGAPTTDFDFNLFALSGPDALTTRANGTITSTNEFNLDPSFLNNTVPPFTGDEFDVQNVALQGASSTSSDLTGWGILQIPTPASAWTLYE